MFELYTHPMSPCAQKVKIALCEKGLKWEPRFVNLAEKQNLTPEYLRLNPKGVVPTLVDNGHPIIESSIICEYIEDTNPQNPLRPANPVDCARMRLWMRHVDDKLHPACGALQWPMVMRPKLMEKTPEEIEAILERVPDKARRERQRRLVKYGLDAPDVADGVKTYRATIEDMERTLARQDWLAGNAFSLAEAAVIPYFNTLNQFGWDAFYIGRFARVTDWFERCRQRPSYRAAIRADIDEDRWRELGRIGAEAWPKLKTLLEA